MKALNRSNWTPLAALGMGAWMITSALVATACAPEETIDEAEVVEVQDEPVVVAPESWEKDGLTVTPLTNSPKYPGATLVLNAPEGTAAAGEVAFDFDVTDYTLGVQTADAGVNGLANSGKGQHIHLILDNEPYSAHYEADFTKELEAGDHVALAFLSRSYHESVKEPSAFVVRQIHVGDGEAAEMDLSGEHLFYSRPKGTYKGADTERLMLDFYLVNTTIGPDGNRVRATVNGTELIFTEWTPYVIEGLPMGETSIRLELIDAEGDPVPGPFNDVTRTVTLEAEPQPDQGS